MPLQNRVNPWGEILAPAARGMFMGNRGGAIHNDDRQVVRQYVSRRYADEMDRELHRARTDSRKGKVTYQAPLGALPDGHAVSKRIIYDITLGAW